MNDHRGQLLLFVLFRMSRSVAAGMITIAFPYLVLTTRHYGALKLGLLYTAAAIATATFTFLLVEMLDTSGTLTAVAHQADLLDEKGHLLNARKALTADAAGGAGGPAWAGGPGRRGVSWSCWRWPPW